MKNDENYKSGTRGGNLMRWTNKRGLFFLFLFILVLPGVHAGFFCGIVNSEDPISSSWFGVRIFYNDSPSQFAYCDVSPDSFKYCCDSQAIPGISWAVGKVIGAQIIDTQNGFIAQPEYGRISGEGYDVLPPLQLTKVFTLHSPTRQIFINTSEIQFNVSLNTQANSLRYRLHHDGLETEEVVCTSCQESVFTLQGLTPGKTEIELIAQEGNENFSEFITFSIVSYLTIERKLQCEDCDGFFILPLTEANMTLQINASHELVGVLREDIPLEWKTPYTEVNPLSTTHSQLEWNVSGTNPQITYALVSPPTFLSKKFVFQSSFDDTFSKEEEITVRKYLPKWKLLGIPSWYSTIVLTSLKKELFYRLSPERAAFVTPKGCDCYFVLHPKEAQKKIIFTSSYEKNSLFPVSYHTVRLGSSVPISSYSSIVFHFKANKKSWLGFKFSSLEAYDIEQDYAKLPLTVEEENSHSIEYSIPLESSTQLQLKQRYSIWPWK